MGLLLHNQFTAFHSFSAFNSFSVCRLIHFLPVIRFILCLDVCLVGGRALLVSALLRFFPFILLVLVVLISRWFGSHYLLHGSQILAHILYLLDQGSHHCQDHFHSLFG